MLEHHVLAWRTVRDELPDDVLVGTGEERGNSVLLSHNTGFYVFDLFLKSGLEVRQKGSNL